MDNGDDKLNDSRKVALITGITGQVQGYNIIYGTNMFTVIVINIFFFFGRMDHT